ncbi:MAG: class I tRNA ligase family protein, partial [Bacteroidales bacterium]|nr:class I tRNA ligase family protein [Bacteroidales bacterium]
PAAKEAVKWFGAKLSSTVALVEDHYSKFRISDALMTIYKLFWDDYCSWYLEAVKPAFVDGVAQPIDKATYDATLGFFEALLKLIHPVMPFITEELWQDIAPRKDGETIMYAPSPKAGEFDPALLDDFAFAAEAVNGVRGVRNQRNIAPKTTLTLQVKAASLPFENLVAKSANASVELVSEFTSSTGVGFMVRTTEMFVVLDACGVNVEEEIAKAQKDLEYQQKFLQGVRAKLSNERFTANAPAAVIENERKKEADSLSKIESLEAKLKQLKNS